MRIRRQHMSGIACMLLILLTTACTNARKPIRWPWSDPDQSADLAKYGPTSAQKIEQLRTMASQAGEADEGTRNQVSQDLADRIRRESDPLVRMEVLRTAAKYRTTTSLAILKGGLKDPDRDVRMVACELWGGLGTEESIRLLGETLNSDSDLDVRVAATKALGATRKPEAVQMLTVALEDPDPALQMHAVESMRATSGKDFGNDVRLWREYAKNPSLEPPHRSIAERIRGAFF